MISHNKLRLGVNIDHVATLRNARGGEFPCPVRAARLAQEAGADGITAHLREDRRHIRDADIVRLKAEVALPLNLEMAATEEMLAIALHTLPHAVCIVPEKRQEVTTEGGLDVIAMHGILQPMVQKLTDAGIRVSLFIAADLRQIEAARKVGAQVVELHTGSYCEHLSQWERSKSPAVISGQGVLAEYPHPSQAMLSPTSPNGRGDMAELVKLQRAAAFAAEIGLEVHAGHGLNYENVQPIAAIPQIVELNIGHFLIGEAVFVGLDATIKKMRQLMEAAR